VGGVMCRHGRPDPDDQGAALNAILHPLTVAGVAGARLLR
jgi:hypothetical protein